MIGQQIDDRRWYGRFDKIEILKRTNGICACCGKKLTVENMTIEHVIPISRGGLDGPSNTIALCERCNRDKGNMLYMPISFYSALIGSKVLDDLNDMFEKWFQTVREDFDIDMFPLIAPRHNLLLDMQFISNCSSRYMYKINNKYIRQNVIQWHYTGKQYLEEVSSITGIDLKQMRKRIESIMPKERPPVALYTCRKLTTEKVLCLAGISMYLEQKTALIAIEWSDMPNNFKPAIYFSLMRLLFNVADLGKYDLDYITLLIPKSEEKRLTEIVSPAYKRILMYDHPDKDGLAWRFLETANYGLQDYYAGMEIKLGKPDVHDVFPKI